MWLGSFLLNAVQFLCCCVVHLAEKKIRDHVHRGWESQNMRREARKCGGRGKDVDRSHPLRPFHSRSPPTAHPQHSIKNKLKMRISSIVLWASFLMVKCSNEEECETLPSEIHITKEEFDELGRLQRTCNGDVAVSKCEGACNSQVQPSVATPNGFLKECFCCRESYLRERVITLDHCYDPDGIRITVEGKATMDIKLREPDQCKCYKCGDYSR